jgi:hypothetical protein
MIFQGSALGNRSFPVVAAANPTLSFEPAPNADHGQALSARYSTSAVCTGTERPQPQSTRALLSASCRAAEQASKLPAFATEVAAEGARAGSRLTARRRRGTLQTATMQKLSVHEVVLRPLTRSPVQADSSRFPAWRTDGLGVVADELALVAARLDPG